MAKIFPYYSEAAYDRKVTHNNSRCEEGNKIVSLAKRAGAPYPVCEECARLNAEEEKANSK